MRNLLFVISLALASSTAAVAQPVPLPHDPYRGDYNPYWERERDRYDRYEGSRWSRDFRSRWVTLATGYSAATNRQFIPMRGRYFDRLRIEAVRGAPVIRQVAVIYTNGTTQKVRLDARLPRGSGEVIRLNRMPIQRVVVYTDPRYGGAYALYGGYGRGSRPGV